MPISTFDPVNSKRMRVFLQDEAQSHGFADIAITSPDAIPQAAGRLKAYLEAGRHGTMGWMADTFSRRCSPTSLWPEVRSIVVFVMNYGPATDPMTILEQRERAAISVYARNRDYHEVMKGRLKQIAGRFASRFSARVKIFVDTAPVMEKPLAAAAGLGWQGKHTNLVSREHGSWLFIGSVFTDRYLPADEEQDDLCGSCRACLDICPTRAFPAPYQLDARRCISYLTIEHKGPIDRSLRAAMGNRVFGCDDCLAVCPWNKFATVARETKLLARDDLSEPELATFLAFDDPEFRVFFRGSPVKRIGRERFLRNVLIAAGNSASKNLVPACQKLLDDPSPLVRGAAVWALWRLLDDSSFRRLADRTKNRESDQNVKREWMLAYDPLPGPEAAV